MKPMSTLRKMLLAAVVLGGSVVVPASANAAYCWAYGTAYVYHWNGSYWHRHSHGFPLGPYGGRDAVYHEGRWTHIRGMICR